MPESQPKETWDEDFERAFAGDIANFRGTEQEITVYKRMAYSWFQHGRASVFGRARSLVLLSVKALDDAREEIERNGIRCR